MFLIFPPTTDLSPGNSRPPPTKAITLVGMHLAAGKAADEFSLTSDTDGSIFIKCTSPAERDEWMAALGKVAGLFRRVEDFYVLGRRWGIGATSEVQECVGRFTRRRLALKTRLHSTRQATEAMHNELRILQLCANHP